MAIGVVGAVCCMLGFRFVQEPLRRHLLITDTAGIHNMHGLPGIVGTLSGVIAASMINPQSRAGDPGMTGVLQFNLIYGETFLNHGSATDTAMQQALMLLVTLAIAISSGLVVGVILKLVGGPSVATTFSDSTFWKVPEDFRRTEGKGSSNA